MIKQNLQRFLCLDCGKSYTYKFRSKRQRYSPEFIKLAVKAVVEDNASYRQVGRKISVSPMTILNWTNRLGGKAKSPIEIAKELHPTWSGILSFDGKPIKVSGSEMTLLIAVDIKTHDPFYFRLSAAEDYENTKQFLLIIREVFQYPIRAIVSDFGKGKVFIELVQDIFPDIPHQACVNHFSRYVDIKLPKSKKSKYYIENNELRTTIRKILFSQNFSDAEECFTRLQRIKGIYSRKYQIEIIRSLERNFDLLTTHFFVENLPRDSNIVENIIKQLNRKLLQTGSFGNESNLYNFLKMWFCMYRFRPFSCSRYPERNGRSPLSIAGAKDTLADWLTFCTQNSNS